MDRVGVWSVKALKMNERKQKNVWKWEKIGPWQMKWLKIMWCMYGKCMKMPNTRATQKVRSLVKGNQLVICIAVIENCWFLCRRISVHSSSGAEIQRANCPRIRRTSQCHNQTGHLLFRKYWEGKRRRWQVGERMSSRVWHDVTRDTTLFLSSLIA